VPADAHCKTAASGCLNWGKRETFFNTEYIYITGFLTVWYLKMAEGEYTSLVDIRIFS
jgi:hypothetical protein